MSNLVSNPADIKDVTDEAELLVSRVKLEGHPSLEDQKAIGMLYAKLEKHLLTRDPLRVFTREELRARIAKRFNLSSSVRTTLWQQNIKEMPDALNQTFQR